MMINFKKEQTRLVKVCRIALHEFLTFGDVDVCLQEHGLTNAYVFGLPQPLTLYELR